MVNINEILKIIQKIIPAVIPASAIIYLIYTYYTKGSISFEPFIIAGIIILTLIFVSILFFYKNNIIKILIKLDFIHKYDRKILNILNGDKSDSKEGQAFREIHDAILYLANIEISCKIFHFDEMDARVYIIHSDRKQASLGGYVYSVPKDEMGIISQLHYWASKTVGNVYLECSSKYINDKEFEKIKCENLISVGGPSKNSATKNLESELKKRVILEYCINDKDQIFLDNIRYCGRDTIWRESGKCYGLVTIAPNPFEVSKFVIIIGGCGKEGQLAILDYFNKHENLKSLLIKSEYSNKYIQFIIEAEYSGKAEDPYVMNSKLFGEIKPIVKI